uniref:Metallothionein n=1 Tax=Eptatretus burgeri TaxID=7764 RepID=A0A8C4NAF9_EPTBU
MRFRMGYCVDFLADNCNCGVGCKCSRCKCKTNLRYCLKPLDVTIPPFTFSAPGSCCRCCPIGCSKCALRCVCREPKADHCTCCA